jgi:hypothetical protein
LHATDRQRLDHSVDDIQPLVRRARSLLFFSVITGFTLLILLVYTTPPDAAILGIYSAEEGDDASPAEALPPTSIAPLRATDAGTPLLGDYWSARVARMLMIVRSRAPPGKHDYRTHHAPPSVPVDSMCLPAVTTDPVVAFFYQATASVQRLRDELAMTQEGPGIVTRWAEPVAQNWREITASLTARTLTAA